MADADWDLGQKLIEQGACSMDQIREILSLQDRMRRMGVNPKPFPRVLLEKGFVRRDQLLKAGVLERDLPPPVEEKPPPPVRPAGTRSKKPIGVGLILLVLVGGLILFARGTFTSGPAIVEPAKPLTEEELDAYAKEHLERITQAGTRSAEFANAVEVVGRFEAFMKSQAGKKWEVEGNRRLKEYRGRADLYAKAEFEEIQAGEGPLRDQQRWVDLLALYRRFPPRFLETTATGRVVRERLQEVTQKLITIYAKDKAEVEQFLKDGKPADALARVKAMELSTPPERSDDLFKLWARVERESRGVAEKARQEVSDAYFKIDGPFREAMSRRDGIRAALVIREFLTAPWKPEQKPFVRVRDVDYDAILKSIEPWDPDRLVALCEAGIPETESPGLMGTGEGALLALRNAASMAIFMRAYKASYDAAVASKEVLDLPNLGKGHFEKQEGKTVFVVVTGEVLEPDTSPLGEEDFAALALKSDPASGPSLARVGFFFFYACPDRQNKAFQFLAMAASKDVRGVKLFLGGLGAASERELQRQLQTKWGAAQDFFKGGRRPQAKRLLGDLLDYPDHSFVKAIRPEIERMLYDIAEGGEKEKKLFSEYKAKVDVVDATALRVTYDFDGKEQQDAFELVSEEGPRKFKGRWHIEAGALESSTDASVARWKPPIQGDVVVEYDLTPIDEPQNIVLDLYYHRGESKHYAVVFAFDWIGKRDGDRDNSAEERFGMPRSCIIKYPVSVEKARWTEAEAWDGWKSRLLGKAGAAWRPEKGKTARIRIEREGKSLRALADRVLVWEGEDAEYTEGQLLFYSDSRCRIDNLSIQFKP
ncbi:MAG TPA: hypothetical protein VE981_15405 [Planctomycetota bacterium]|nr:hypothetical protein [Planctomycetota bacterium]